MDPEGAGEGMEQEERMRTMGLAGSRIAFLHLYKNQCFS